MHSLRGAFVSLRGAATTGRLRCREVASPLLLTGLHYKLQDTRAESSTSGRMEADDVRDSNLPTASDFYQFQEIDKDVFQTSLLSTAHQNSERAAYGGLVFSQALAAAESTVSDVFKPHALASFFILGVDTKKPIQYVVKRLRDGRSFCTRAVEAIQNDQVAFSMQASFHVREPQSIIHQNSMPVVRPPEELVPIRAAGARIRAEVDAGTRTVSSGVLALIDYRLNADIFDDKNSLFEIRPVEPERYYSMELVEGRKMHFWFRLRVPLDSDDPRLHRYLFTFATDSLPASTAIRAHQGNGLKVSMVYSLSHNVWIHEDEGRADEWHLYELSSTTASGARAFVEGRWWRRDGRLLMTVAQEVLVRTKGAPSQL